MRILTKSLFFFIFFNLNKYYIGRPNSNLVKTLLETKSKDTLYGAINLFILLDIVLIAYLMFFNVSGEFANYVIIFDVLICAILLVDFLAKFLRCDDRRKFAKHNLVFFIASIPFELVLPAYFMAFRFLLLLKLFKLSGVVEKYFENIHRFVENTRFDRMLTWIAFTVIIFTIAIYLLDSSLGLFDSLWYVIVTLTTVGYGDVTPTTVPAKIVSILLLILGICVFSILTGAISSYFTDKILNIDTDTEEELDVVEDRIDHINSQLNDIKDELELARAENRKLHEKLDKLLKDQ